MRRILFLFLSIIFIPLQNFSSPLMVMPERIKPKIGGYLEMYYLYNFQSEQNHLQPGFLYNYNRNNEVNLNLGLIQCSYTSNTIKMSFGLMAGTYPVANLAGEPGVFRHIYESSIGFKASKKRNLWVEAGIFPSHLGFESAIGSDNLNLTRSLCAESSPYYESGVKVNWTSKNNKWFLRALYLNGWQHIVRASDNNMPAFGTQLTYKKDDKYSINWSTFIGNEYPDNAQKWRYFSNLYSKFSIKGRTEIIVGFDIGMEQKYSQSSYYLYWLTPTLAARYQLGTFSFLGARIEYFYDENEIIIESPENGTGLLGCSINYDRKISNLIFWRTEARLIKSKDNIFDLNNNPSPYNFFIGTSLSVKF